MTSDADEGAVAALTDLGLSTYAARTFVGLQKLGAASAGEVAEVTEVPRSQVYGATDELEALGLVDVQEGSPRRYRPVGVEEARDLLYERLRSTADDAFDHLESVRGARADRDDGREAIWTTTGRQNVTARITDLVAAADARVLYATGDPRLLEGPVLTALADAAADGVAVSVASADPDVRDLAADAGLAVTAVHDETTPDIDVGRVLVVDDDTVALSVRPSAAHARVDAESAFWSQGTGFATILAGLVREHLA